MFRLGLGENKDRSYRANHRPLGRKSWHRLEVTDGEMVKNTEFHRTGFTYVLQEHPRQSFLLDDVGVLLSVAYGHLQPQ